MSWFSFELAKEVLASGSARRRSAAKIAQSCLAKSFGVNLACLRKLDDFAGNQRLDALVALCEIESQAGNLESEAHDPPRLRVKSNPIKVRSDRHVRLPIQAGAHGDLSAADD